MRGIGGAHGMREYFCKPSLPQGVAHAVALEPVCPASGLSSHPPGTSVQVRLRVSWSPQLQIAWPLHLDFQMGLA